MGGGKSAAGDNKVRTRRIHQAAKGNLVKISGGRSEPGYDSTLSANLLMRILCAGGIMNIDEIPGAGDAVREFPRFDNIFHSHGIEPVDVTGLTHTDLAGDLVEKRIAEIRHRLHKPLAHDERRSLAGEVQQGHRGKRNSTHAVRSQPPWQA